MGRKQRPLLITDFSAFESGRCRLFRMYTQQHGFNTSFHQNAMCFSYYNTTAHVLLQYRSATYTTFLPSLKYTLIQTECNKTKSKHLNASKCLRTSFVAKEIIRTNSEKKAKHQRTVQLNKRSINVLFWVKPNASQNIIMISRWHFPHSRRT